PQFTNAKSPPEDVSRSVTTGDPITSSGANVEAHVTETLAIRASSGSDIDVIGSPVVTLRETSSGGDLALVN
ncbi:MAG: hypothetical protein AAFR34_08675, partial [Pseudomonadota bacterium]